MNNLIPPIPTQVQVGIDNAYKNRQIEINAAKIQQESTAEKIAMQLYEEIIEYQNNLPDSEDVAIMLVQFNQSTTILVENIGYIGYTLISFHGKDNNGNPLELIQHISQLNFLLTVVSKPVPEAPKRRIGFVVD